MRYSDGCGSAFSAGGNIKAMQEGRAPFGGPGVHIADSYRQGIHRIIRSLWQLEVPAIAAVNGRQSGWAMMSPAYAISALRQKAPFSVRLFKNRADTRRWWAWLLPRQIGLSRASELLFTGKTIPAEIAAEWGLVSEVVDDDTLMETARALADEICAQSPEALRAAKRLLRNGQSASFDTVMEMSATTQALMHQMSDHQAAIIAMLDKVEADYKDE